MIRNTAILLTAMLAGTALAGDPPGDRALIEQAAKQRQPAPAVAVAQSAPVATEPPAANLDDAERAARTDANLALARLELVLGRKLLQAEDYRAAARKAQRTLVLLRQIPPGVDVSELELQAEGILSRVARAGVNVDALAAADADPVPPPAAERRAVRESAPRRPASDRFGYRPGNVVFDVDSLLANEEQSAGYQEALRNAYKSDEVRALVDADESRRIPNGIVSYPPDWPQRVQKRQKWADGVIARSPSWRDKDGREWYVAIYDVQDLIYVPPNFERTWKTPYEQRRDDLDRRAFWDNPYLFFSSGHGDDAVSLLRYFGGVDAIADRGPKYSFERQMQIVDMIKAFTDTAPENITVIPPAPQ